MYLVTPNPIDLTAVLAEVTHPGAGGLALFVGTTRDENDGRRVERLEYEAYDEMATSEMAAIGAEIRRRWPVLGVAMVHRVGVVPIEEASVAVAVAAPHREAAFAACRYGIDTLKAQVPIWKKEHYADGSRWIGACHADDTPHAHAAQGDEGRG